MAMEKIPPFLFGTTFPKTEREVFYPSLSEPIKSSRLHSESPKYDKSDMESMMDYRHRAKRATDSFSYVEDWLKAEYDGIKNLSEDTIRQWYRQHISTLAQSARMYYAKDYNVELGDVYITYPEIFVVDSTFLVKTSLSKWVESTINEKEPILEVANGEKKDD